MTIHFERETYLFDIVLASFEESCLKDRKVELLKAEGLQELDDQHVDQVFVDL